MLRIAMLCSTHWVNDERVAHKQARSLAKAGHEVIIFGRQPTSHTEIDSVCLVPLASGEGGLLKRLVMMFKLYKAAKLWKPDVVVCHEPESAMVGLLLKNRYAIKMIFDVHEFFYETFLLRLPRILRPFVRPILIMLLKILVYNADWITVVSPTMKRHLSSMRRDNRIDILCNSPIIEFFPPCNQEIAGPVTIVHDGFLSRGRGLVQMLEAIAIARRNCDIRFLVLGQVQTQDQKLFDDRVSQLGLDGIITVTGWKPWTEIGRIESQAQIGLICLQNTRNNFWGLGNKLYNYMSCGQAVIGPEGSDTAEMIRKYDCGLCVDTSQPQKIAEAILKLCNNAELRKSMGDNGRKAIEQELGWHKMEERLGQIYKQLSS